MPSFALKPPGVWFLRVRFVIFAPDSRREPSPPSGRKSTQPTVQILEASSLDEFYRIAFRKKIYGSIADLQVDLDQLGPKLQ